MHFTKEIAVLDGQWVCLESIDAYCKDLVLVQDDTAMPLPTRDLKTLGLSKVDQLTVLFGIYHNKDLHSIPTLLFIGVFREVNQTFYSI